MLLYHQDRISQLEEKLQTVDEDERKVIFHGSWRRDTNPERKAIIDQLQTAIADYGTLAFFSLSFIGDIQYAFPNVVSHLARRSESFLPTQPQ